MQKKRNRNFVEKKSCNFFFSLTKIFFFFLGGGGWKSFGGVGNHLKHVEMQKKKIQIFFKNGRHSGHIGFWTKSKI